MEGRIPPQAVEVEESVLGCCLIFGVNDVAEHLLPIHFYKPAHRIIYQAMLDLHIDNMPVDQLTVEQRLRDEDQLPSVGGIHYLTDLTKRPAVESQLEYYSQIIKDKYVARQAIVIFTDGIKEAYDSDGYLAIDEVMHAIHQLDNSRTQGIEHISDILQGTVQEIIDNQDKEEIALKTGLALERIIDGWFNGGYYIIAGRPSMGKTAFALTVINRLSEKGKKCGLISIEMTKKSLAIRLLASDLDRSQKDIIGAKIGEETANKLIKSAAKLSERDIFIDDSSRITPENLYSKAKKMIERDGVEFLMVDYLQLVQNEDFNEVRGIGKISSTLNQIAKDFDIPVVVLSQLSRKVEDRRPPRPVLSDLRGSGDIEQDADVVIFLYRPEYYNIQVDAEGHSTENICEVIVAKNRNGATGFVKQMFHKESMTFKNLI